MKELFIEIEDKYVRLHEWGYKEKPIIICLHGLGSTSLSFIEIGDILKDKYHIFSIDLPGHGKTPQFPKEEDYQTPNIIEWLDKVISTITQDKFFILAHSWGADIALHYIAKYQAKVKKALLLDGGYYLKKDYYSYEASRGGKINTLQSEIDYYKKDFDDYCFDSLEEHIKVEKDNYSRWSTLLEEAAKDLIRIEDEKYKWNANGITAAGAIKSMYYYPPDSIHDKLPSTICLLQSTQPYSMSERRDFLVKKFKDGTGAKAKKIEGAGHMIHWDKPNEVVNEILNWFR